MGGMMQSNQVLDDAFSRIPGVARRAVADLDAEALRWQPEPESNPIGWLVWHLARVQDDHVAELVEGEQVWVAESWAPRFELPEGTTETGFGHSPEQVRAVRPDGAEALLDYLDAVTERTRSFLATVSDGDLDRVVDTSWDPPVTMGARLVSVIGDGLQHVGQASYLRGLHDRTAQG
jgi:uncharacterized damage-inducible protein DinB